MRHYLFVDIDHTVSRADWRDEFKGDWDKYHAMSYKDEPNWEVIKMAVDLQRAGWTTIGLTARPGKWRNLTIDWLFRYGVRFESLIMREDDAFHPSAQLKVALLKKFFEDLKIAIPKEYIIILDDHPEVCRAFAALNLTVMQVHAQCGVNPNRKY